MDLPIEHKHLAPDTDVASEEEKEALLQAAKVVENYCNERQSICHIPGKLKHVSSLLPPVFNERFKVQRFC